MFGKHSNQVTSHLQVTEAETLTLFNQIGVAGTPLLILLVRKSSLFHLRNVTQGVAHWQ